MKLSLPMAAALFAALAAAAGGVRTANAEPCAGPFRQCADAVGATCSRDQGGQVINYWNHLGNVMMFERCAGSIFEAAGQQNPYKTGTTSGPLAIPRTELHYPVEPK